MVVSGQVAQRCAGILAELGVAFDVLAGPAGAATSRKLLRSMFWKGVAAAVVEALTRRKRAAFATGWTERAAELAGFAERTVDVLFRGPHTHARSRADEMAAAAELLTELGVSPRVTAAARDQFAALRDGQRS